MAQAEVADVSAIVLLILFALAVWLGQWAGGKVVGRA